MKIKKIVWSNDQQDIKKYHFDLHLSYHKQLLYVACEIDGKEYFYSELHPEFYTYKQALSQAKRVISNLLIDELFGE